MRTLARLVITAALVVMMTIACAAVASAHAVRIAVDPAENASLTTGPARVSATFNEPMQSAFAAMTVVGPDGNLWSTGEPEVSGAVLSIALRALGPTGDYTVNYRVTSADGHVVTGSWTFRLTTAGTGEPGPSAAATSAAPSGMPVWPFVVGATVLIGGGALWAARRKT